MTQEDVAKFKDSLERLKNEILLLIKEEEDPAFSREALDAIDMTSDMLVRQMSSRMSSNHKNNLGKVEDALQRIKENTYGTCTECGGEIPAKRLELLPFAELCVPCREEEERYS